MPKISIIIPVYNVEEYIKKALDSMCSQTLEDIECICIDDCSTDNSKKIIQEYVEKDSRFRLISLSENKGQGSARNLGIQNAHGEYLMFLDSDDWYANNACEVVYNHMIQNNSDIGTFNFFRFNEKDNKLVLFDFCRTFRPSDGLSCKHIFRTQFIRENDIKFGTGRNCEDNPFFLKSMILTDKISRIKVPLYYYRKRIGGSSRDCFGRSLDIIKSKSFCYDIIKDKRNIVPEWSLAYCINSTFINFENYYHKFKNKKLKKDFYNKTRELFVKIKNDDFYKNNFSEDINYKEFQKIVKYNYYQYNIMNSVEKNIIKLKECFV